MRPAARVLIAVLTTLLAIAIVLVVVSWPSDGVADASAGPSPTGTPAPSPSASRDEAPSADPSADASEVFAEIERQVRAIRGLPAPEIGPPDIITRDQLAGELEEMLDQEWTEEDLRRSNLTLRAMGLLEPDQDIRELTEDLLAGQVAGFYDPLEQRMVVVSDSGLTAETRIYYAHEYTHALQDAAFATFDERDQLTDDDAILARQALEEGDATAVMVQWAFSNLSPDELSEITAQPVPDMSGIPEWMVRQLLFPYNSGVQFVVALGGLQDTAALDAAYDDPPVSTEQVLHPEKYAAGEAPVDVAAPEPATSLGAGWEDVEPTTMGEAMIAIWLAHLGVEVPVADDAAAGWGGDRLTAASGPEGEWAMAWTITWDTSDDADAFADAYRSAGPGSGIATRLVRSGPMQTTVLHASAPDLLAEL